MADVKPIKHGWRFKDLAGQRFGRLVAIENVPRQYASGTCRGATMWRCQCDCTKIVIVSYSNLINGGQISCGCYRRDNTPLYTTFHGKAGTPEYVAWQHAKDRCFNPKNKSFANYGGRGIQVCDEWLNFETFYADMGDRPSAQHTLDRINNDGPYSKANCRWATKIEQNNNRRRRSCWKLKDW